MQPTVFGAIVVVLGIWSQFGPPGRIIAVMFGLTVFGAASALDLPALGGASVTPANFFLIFYAIRFMSAPNGVRDLAREVGPGKPLFFFLVLLVWVIISAILLPRVFEGAIDVFSLSRSDSNEGDLTSLHPTGGNLSQAVYAIGGFSSACLTAAYVRRFATTDIVVSAIAFCTTLHLAFAVLDIVTGATHTSFILDPIHTASYSFLTADELGGLKRISGSFSEASAFAAFSLSLLGVNFTLFVLDVRPLFTGFASLMLTAFIAAATSSAGYIGLATFFGAFMVYAVVVALLRGKTRPLGIALGAVAALVVLASIVVIFIPSVADIAQAVVTDSLLTKATSDSAIERGAMNAQAWEVFKGTYGVGAGIGSTRSSNYALVLLSNLGVPGLLLFVIMILRLSLSRVRVGPSETAGAITWAVRIGVLTTLVPSLLTGTVFDLGALFFCLIGIAAAGIGLRVDTAMPFGRVEERSGLGLA